MNILDDILAFALKEKEPETDTPEMAEACEKAQAVYERLAALQNEYGQKMLLELDIAYIKKEGTFVEHAFKEGGKEGFRLAVKLILGALV